MVERTFVIGDLHGCVDELSVMLDAIAPNAGDTVVFLGDYIDRGPDSRGVVDRLLRLETEGPRCVFLKGNHEDMFLSFLGRDGHFGEAFLNNGGARTLESYGLYGCATWEIAERLPPRHFAFFERLEVSRRFEDYLCVHAGVDPLRPLHSQRDEDLMWIRHEFIGHPHDFGCTVLFGHTPQREVLLDLPYKIGLDTGVVYRNKLSCLELRDKRLYQVERDARAAVTAELERNFGEARR